MEKNDTLLAVKGVYKYFGGLSALNGVDLTVRQGTITALIGPNGAGKTTLVNIVSGADKPSDGEILFDGKIINKLPPYKRAEMGLSRTFQLTKLFRQMSVIENVMVGAHTWARKGNLWRTILNLPSARRELREVYDYAMDILKITNMEKLAHEKASNLPHGQQRALEVARAVATRPRLVLLDEPAAGLNPREDDMLQETLRSVVRSGVTILMVEHHMRLVMNVSDWVHVLDLGTKIAEGTTREIGRNPSVIKAYLGKEY